MEAREAPGPAKRADADLDALNVFLFFLRIFGGGGRD